MQNVLLHVKNKLLPQRSTIWLQVHFWVILCRKIKIGLWNKPRWQLGLNDAWKRKRTFFWSGFVSISSSSSICVTDLQSIHKNLKKLFLKKKMLQSILKFFSNSTNDWNSLQLCNLKSVLKMKVIIYVETFILTGLDLRMCDKYVDLSNEKLSRGPLH